MSDNKRIKKIHYAKGYVVLCGRDTTMRTKIKEQVTCKKCSTLLGKILVKAEEFTSKEQQDKILEEISECVNKFLMRNGGLDNGYVTWVVGEVRTDILFGSLQWLTHKAGELTGNDKHELGCKLYDQVQKIMLEYEIEMVKFENKHIEDGCYYTKASIVHSRIVRLRRIDQ
jgi:hypothetical protein